ncbi:MAG TPA: Zn-ribbon domain-containing OB-fold protein [Candidatus Acidoferrales bacterium]|nr:Zn-ribbon domain-containing OB-fold protein [Candidatus Acidoferrales bacterium]
MSEYFKPLPKPTPTSRPFWDAAKRHELSIQRCGACKSYVYYPRDRCPHCFADQLEWQRVSGRGRVYSYTVVRRASARSFGDGPYVLAIVELEEGPRMTSNIVAPPEKIRVDMPVEVFFDDVTPDRTLVKFKPA